MVTTQRFSSTKSQDVDTYCWRSGSPEIDTEMEFGV